MAGAFEVPAQLATTMTGHTASVLCVRATATGKYCLSGAKDRTVRLWNPTKGTHINTYRGNGGDVQGVAVSADNRHFVSCGTDRSINHFDVSSGSVLRRFTGHDGAVNAVQYAAEESLLVSASYDATVRFWDLKGRSTRPIDTVKAASDSVTSLAALGNATVIAGAVDGTVTAIDVRRGRLVRDEVHQPVTSVAAPVDGLYVAAACTDNSVRLLDAKSGAVLARYEGHRHQEFQLECALLADDGVVACGSEDGKVFMWDVASRKVLGSVAAHTGVTTSLCPVPDANGLLTAGADCSIKFWRS